MLRGMCLICSVKLQKQAAQLSQRIGWKQDTWSFHSYFWGMTQPIGVAQSDGACMIIM